MFVKIVINVGIIVCIVYNIDIIIYMVIIIVYNWS